VVTLAKSGKRVGRPPTPREPDAPEPHEAREYADRLQALVDALEVGELAKDVRLYLQRTLRRCDLLRSIDADRFPTKGDERVTVLLRAVFESTNGAPALTVPILRAVSSCMEPAWVEKGLAFIEAFDFIDLAALWSTLGDLGLVDQFDRALRRKLEGILGFTSGDYSVDEV
jgi:hypothetical protein